MKLPPEVKPDVPSTESASSNFIPVVGVTPIVIVPELEPKPLPGLASKTKLIDSPSE